MTNHQLQQEAVAVLRLNDRGDFSTPSPGQYPHQWNWDAALIALGWSHVDMARARAEIRSLLRAQWRDGMVPHIIYHGGASDYFPPPDFWQTRDLPHAGTVESSAFTQPPLVATVVRMLHARASTSSARGASTSSARGASTSSARGASTGPSSGSARDAGALDFVREVYPQILAWHRWLHHTRDADGTGLPCLIHPWESGADNSPRWAAALAQLTPRDLPPFRRRDTRHVAADERPLPRDYECFVYLIDRGRCIGWDAAQLLASSEFLVQDVVFCAILHRADEDLLALARLLDADTSELEGWIAQTQSVFDERFWNPARGLYFDYNVRAGAPIEVNAFSTFLPLFAGLSSPAQVERLMAHWHDPTEYAPGADSRFRVPTISKDEPGYAPRRYWCGPVWVHTNWLIYDGLKRYRLDAEAASLRADTLALVEMQGFREYYDPRDGSGLGAADFGWSAALYLEWLAEEEQPRDDDQSLAPLAGAGL